MRRETGKSSLLRTKAVVNICPAATMVVLNLAFVNFSQSIVPTECMEAYSPFKLFLIQIVSSA